MSEELSGRRVGILIASLQLGGAERAALGLLDGLLAAGVDAYLLTLDRNRDMAAVAGAGRQAELTRRIVSLSRADIGWSTVSKMLVGPVQWWQLRRAVRRLRLDTVISIVERANIMNLLRLGGGRRVISIRSYPSRLLASKGALKRRLVVGFYRGFLRNADRIVFVSHEAAADFERLFPGAAGRGIVIHNSCDLVGVRERGRESIPTEHEAIFEHPTVVACGRLMPEKGHWNLLRSFAAVARKHAAPRLVVVGRGPLEAELRGLAAELGIADRVHFTGFQPNPLPWIARAAAFVLPSHWEGFPNSLLEALALGVPVVSTDCRSGPRELLAPDTDPEVKTSVVEQTPAGFLVPAPDERRRPAPEAITPAESALAEAMERALFDDGFRRDQAEAARRLAAEFAPERILPRWHELIEEPGR